MPKFSLMIARFPYKGAEHPDTTDWLIRTVIKAKTDPCISDVFFSRIDDTPITMTRNLAVKAAQAAKADYLLMLDSDMKPDLPSVPGEPFEPFWDASWKFMLENRQPCLIAAPYVGPPPHCNVYCFRWGNKMNQAPNPDQSLDQFTREETERLHGIQRVAALPTGLMLMDMRVFQKLTPPYFYYEWTDDSESVKASTEDVTFSRDVSLAGFPIYCTWSSWAGHWKSFLGERPRSLQPPDLRRGFGAALYRQLEAQLRQKHFKEFKKGLKKPRRK